MNQTCPNTESESGPAPSPKNCAECGGADLIEDATVCGILCLDCGALIETSNLQNECEIKGFTGDGRPERAGHYVGNLSGLCAGMDHTGAARSAADEASVNERRRAVDSTVGRICFTVRLEKPSFHSSAMDMMSRVTRGRWGTGRWIRVLAAASVYFVARKEKQPLPLVRVADAVEENAFVIGRVFLRLQSFLGISIPTNDPALLLTAACAELGLSHSPSSPIIRDTLKVINIAHHDWLVIGRRPGGLTAAALGLVSAAHQKSVSDAQLAKACYVSESTVKLRTVELRQRLVNLGKQLPWGDKITVRNVVESHLLDILDFASELFVARENSETVVEAQRAEQPRTQGVTPLCPRVVPGCVYCKLLASGDLDEEEADYIVGLASRHDSIPPSLRSSQITLMRQLRDFVTARIQMRAVTAPPDENTSPPTADSQPASNKLAMERRVLAGQSFWDIASSMSCGHPDARPVAMKRPSPDSHQQPRKIAKVHQ